MGHFNRKIVFATLRKELLLLLRDPGGLLLLVLMPAALIIVMAVVQDAPYRDYQEMKFEILVANKDKGNTGTRLIEGLKKNKSFIVVDRLDGRAVSDMQLKAALRNGKYKMGIVIPKEATASLVNTSNKLANEMAGAMGLPAGLPVQERQDSAAIQLLFDPVVKPSFRSALGFALNQYLTQVKTEILLQRLSRVNGGTGDKHIDLESMNVLAVAEKSLDDGPAVNPSMNSTQHNVPAWAIFGMFLIVVPISGNMIRERDEGSALRIRLIPTANKRVGLGKIVFYILVCMLQFFVMMLVGIFILPFFGLQRLTLGQHALNLIPMAFAISFAAVNYGYFIGSIFKTANQAMPFGAISIVLFSAIGGVWVPIEILPEAMKKIALFSPLHWSLEGVNEVILRNNGWSGIFKSFSILVGSGMLLGVMPVFLGKK
ncbi:ABC transporter permease [Taibaiella koreensis]|uniref:ABC transporter permease n=1 Tax=Taibaiella koreensis TaxID=1268548 RepID=UPI0013C32EB7|nr:ABC transporter permease [Taibaiella koreensis]